MIDAQLRFASDLDAKLGPLVGLVAAALAIVYSQAHLVGEERR